ncbi:MAG: hypothetical protein SOT41_04840 [Candidatus Faecisoma sp.]|nr:hypothetical protein [Acholeplasma sp.]MDY2893084.1 hypothetical protein [Candidatus Faecisoma sp.]
MDKANEITKTNEGIKTNENFKLLSKLETLVSYINNVLVNYPKYNVVLRNQIELTMYSLVECVHSYRISNISRVRSKNMNDFIIKLSMLDYYMRISYEKKIINKHKLKVIGNYLLEIRKIAFGVIRSEKSEI